MTQGPTTGAANGGHDPGFRIAVIIDSDISNQLETRAALRRTGLFALLISCESTEIAREVIESQDVPPIHLVLLDVVMADDCLPLMSDAMRARTVLMHDADAALDSTLMALPRPISTAVIEDVMARFDPLD